MHRITTEHLAIALAVAALAAAGLAIIDQRRSDQRKVYLRGVTDALTGLGELNRGIVSPIARAAHRHDHR